MSRELGKNPDGSPLTEKQIVYLDAACEKMREWLNTLPHGPLSDGIPGDSGLVIQAWTRLDVAHKELRPNRGEVNSSEV